MEEKTCRDPTPPPYRTTDLRQASHQRSAGHRQSMRVDGAVDDASVCLDRDP